MQNFARFWTTSKFGGEYIWKGWKYSKSDKFLIYHDSSCVRWNKSGEVWFSNLGDLDVKSYPPKAPFSEDHISALLGCCAPKFLHAIQNCKVLLAYLHRGRGPLTIFKRGSKIGLKCSNCIFITSLVVGVAPQHFVTWCAAMWRW